jgi:hypothetical protein
MAEIKYNFISDVDWKKFGEQLGVHILKPVFTPEDVIKCLADGHYVKVPEIAQGQSYDPEEFDFTKLDKRLLVLKEVKGSWFACCELKMEIKEKEKMLDLSINEINAILEKVSKMK